jgi:sugar/nucleoside kinase (ribokinase family)
MIHKRNQSWFEKGAAVIGSTTIDENIHQTGSLQKIGGTTTYSGITYRRHGIATYIVSNIAQQDIQVAAALEKEKIIVTSGSTAHTTHFINDVTKGERRQKIPFRAAPIKTAHIAGIVKRVSSIHLGPLHPMDIDPAGINIIQESNLPVVLDVQGYTRRVKGKCIARGVSQHLASAMLISRFVKASETELQAICGYFSLDIAALLKTYKIEELVVTRGQKGGFVKDSKGSVYPYDAVKVGSILDPTGAGDVFLAAYIVGRFLNLLNIADACAYAARLSAEQISGSYITRDSIVI